MEGRSSLKLRGQNEIKCRNRERGEMASLKRPFYAPSAAFDDARNARNVERILFWDSLLHCQKCFSVIANPSFHSILDPI